VERDGDAVGNTLLELCQIGDDRVKSQGAEMLAQLLQVALLVRPGPPETGNQVAEQLKPGIEMLSPALLNRAKIAPWPGPERALPIALFGVVNYQ
jgi:hypothetical protein